MDLTLVMSSPIGILNSVSSQKVQITTAVLTAGDVDDHVGLWFRRQSKKLRQKTGRQKVRKQTHRGVDGC